jgi:type II restriction enzyme
MTYISIIKKSDDLVTTREQTRAGFINFALEKNRRSTPIIDNAKTLKVLASKATKPKDLLKLKDIRPALLTAAGLSDKAVSYFTETDKDIAIGELIRNFLEPAGEHFVDELVYRYLLIKGDSLGGSMRNIVGAMAQQKLIRTLLSNMSVMGVGYQWLRNDTKTWQPAPKSITSIEGNLKAVAWKSGRKNRILAFNLNIPVVENNVDICLFDSTVEGYGKGEIVNDLDKILMLGELKGGIDPAGADEHWKTGNTALTRIRNSFKKEGKNIATSFVAAAIEKAMADEIFNQLKKETLSFAVNITKDEQLVKYCNWIIKF